MYVRASGYKVVRRSKSKSVQFQIHSIFVLCEMLKVKIQSTISIYEAVVIAKLLPTMNVDGFSVKTCGAELQQKIYIF